MPDLMPLATPSDYGKRRDAAEAVVKFLTTNPMIQRLNFSFLSFKLYPGAYRTDVANAIKKGDIKLTLRGGSSPDARCSYYPEYDTLDLAPDINVALWSDQAFLIHECTHAHLDIQNLGKISNFENEATAFVAEALFLEVLGKPPLGSQKIRTLSHQIAQALLATNGYAVPAGDARALVVEVSIHPNYKPKPSFESKAFKRSAWQSYIRPW